MKRIIITGSSGLIGSEVSTYFSKLDWEVYGIDNNQRAVFFGPQGDTRWNQHRLESTLSNFKHIEADIRNRQQILEIFQEIKPDAIVHAAAQPSHDRAADIPFDDFDTNAVGTLNLLESSRRVNPEIPFIHLSTNKVYGDAPNEIALKEESTRWEYDDPQYFNGIPETFRIDRTKHSLFGASKAAADIMVQEYGLYFGMPTVCLRGGCLTGPNHSGVELHGFLSYLIKCNLEGKKYFIYGYKGKQVRDNIHSHDVARFIDAYIQSPRAGEVYNIGGGKANTCSILEAFDMITQISGRQMVYEYKDQHRIGDHICYYSDLTKMKAHYPSWDISVSLQQVFEEIYRAWMQKEK